MTSYANQFFNKFLAAVAISVWLVAPPIQAQQVYRIVGADGKVTFSDKPPVETNAKVTAGVSASSGASSASVLPFELRQIASKYPVTLYTGDNCSPCASARSMLISRGVPFTEKSVTTADDGQALQRISGDNSLPFATIGSQQLKGFSDSEWTQFLNAAGYPAASVLPANYRQLPATPLVSIATAPSAGTNAAANPATPPRPVPVPAAPPAPAANNPAGIKF